MSRTSFYQVEGAPGPSPLGTGDVYLDLRFSRAAGGPCLVRRFIKLRVAGGHGLRRNSIKLRVPPVPRTWGPGRRVGRWPLSRTSFYQVEGAPGPWLLGTGDVYLDLRFSRAPQVPLLGPGKLQSFPCPMRKITPRRRTMEIEKPMKDIVGRWPRSP